MAGWIQAGLFYYSIYLESQQWNVARIFTISLGRKKSDKSFFTLGLPFRVIDLDANVVKVALPVHG